nr:hypothetical protein [Tanacetum cinerariifolium]
MKRLPVKSLVQFPSVSKQWKSFIDSPEFIKNYHINHTNPQHHLLLRYKFDDDVQTYTSIIDNNTFPQQKFPLTALESLRLLRGTLTLGSVNGLLCFCGFYGDVDSKTKMVAVIWNPTVRKSVGIVIPKASNMNTIVGFGVCPDTSDLKLVKISDAKIPSMWEVFVNGVIYFGAYDFICLNDGVRSNCVISFDLKSEKFSEVCLPERLVHVCVLTVAKVNESLGLLEYYFEGETKTIVCGVWSRKDGANKPFTKIHTVKVEGKGWLSRVLGFRNNGEAVIELLSDDVIYEESQIEVYAPRYIFRVVVHGNATFA